MEITGVVVIVLGLSETGLLLWKGRISAPSIFTFGLIVILAGVTIGDLRDIRDVMMSVGGGSAFHVQLQDINQKAVQVSNDAADVRSLKQQVNQLFHKTELSEKRVADMSNAIQNASRLLFEAAFYELGTHNLVPLPQSIQLDIIQRLVALGPFAYPNQQTMNASINKMLNDIQANLPPSSSQATPSHK